MIKFNTIEDSALNSASESQPVLIKYIKLLNDDTEVANISDFVGSVIKGDDEFGSYLVLEFKDLSAPSYSVNKIQICDADELPLAESEAVTILKAENKQLKLRVSAQFDDAVKCIFENIVINLPYATHLRDGIVRFAKENESDKTHTVYSAAQVDNIIGSSSDSTDHSAFVRWDSSEDGSIINGDATINNLTTERITFTSPEYEDAEASIYISQLNEHDQIDLNFVNCSITGDVLANEPYDDYDDDGNFIGIHTDSKLATDSYVAVFVESAKSDYISNEDSDTSSKESRQLPTKVAVIDYVNDCLNGDENDIVHKSGDETIIGLKTFAAGISADTYLGDGIYSTYSSNTWAKDEDIATNGDTIPGTKSKIPTVAAVEAAINARLGSSSSDFQSQIDALNAGQNLADIVNDEEELESNIKIINLRAKDDFVSDEDADRDESDRAKWGIGDKVQVLHDRIDHKAIDEILSDDGLNGYLYDAADDSLNPVAYNDETEEISDSAASTNLGDRIREIPRLEEGVATVYELVRMADNDTGDFEASHPHCIKYTGTTENGAQYYWKYIGVYGCDSYNKSESDTKFFIKENVVTDNNFNDDNLNDDTVPSTLAVYNAIETAKEEIGENYVTISTDQNITGNKSFKSNLNIYSSDNDDVKIITSAGGGTSDSSAGCNIQMMDGYKCGCAVIDLNSQRNNQGVHTKVRTSKYDDEWNTFIGDVLFYQGWGQHYGVVTYDSYLTTAQSQEDTPLVGAWHDRAPEFTQSSGTSYNVVDDNAERIRIRRTVSTSDVAGGKYNGTHTFIDLYADHITTLGKDINFEYVDSSNNKFEALKIGNLPAGARGENLIVYSQDFCGGYKVPNYNSDGEFVNYTKYNFGTAGSLSYTTMVSNETADNDSVPTTAAIKSYVDTVVDNTPLTGISEVDNLGSIGLFMYTEPGDEKALGATVFGRYLKSVGMTLPLSGQIAFKSSSIIPALTGTWRLLSLALKRTESEPCLVLAQKISNDDIIPLSDSFIIQDTFNANVATYETRQQSGSYDDYNETPVNAAGTLSITIEPSLRDNHEFGFYNFPSTVLVDDTTLTRVYSYSVFTNNAYNNIYYIQTSASNSSNEVVCFVKCSPELIGKQFTLNYSKNANETYFQVASASAATLGGQLIVGGKNVTTSVMDNYSTIKILGLPYSAGDKNGNGVFYYYSNVLYFRRLNNDFTSVVGVGTKLQISDLVLKD